MRMTKRRQEILQEEKAGKGWWIARFLFYGALLGVIYWLLFGDGMKQESPDIYLEDLYSPYAILLDGESGAIITSKRAGEKIYPASMTKMMTAIVAIEHTADWETRIELSGEMIRRLYYGHASLAGFEEGEQVAPKELLYGILLPSGAECCEGYACYLAGDEGTFVEWMNEKASELGMKNTHFVNTTGLHHEEHYSTVEDMALLLKYCLGNEIFREVIRAKEHEVSDSSGEKRIFTSTLHEHLTGRELINGEILGGKTGYTSRAGLCLASVAIIDGKEYLLVTAGALGTTSTEPFHVKDAVKVYKKIDRHPPVNF